ncbi:MAG: tyrosine-type recombinase/integrase, partial [Phycisphaerae bacterium]|nr:tyrosine-type recombinase/integrase [Phycisphaerae bacterium]
ETTRWLSGLDDDLYAALTASGLAEPRERVREIPTVRQFTSSYIDAKRPALAARSVKLLDQSFARLIAAVGGDTRIDKVTAAAALDWRAGMLRSGLSEAFVRLHSRNAKALFNEAIRREMITKSPFKCLPTAAIAANRSFYLPVTDAEKVLAKLEDDHLKIFFGLMRYGALRAPSETHILTWGQIDLAHSRMTVYAPKTGQTRVVPVVPRLRELLAVIRPRRPDPHARVLSLSVHNLHKKILEGIDAAGLERWDDLFQALRRAAATDFARSAPPHAVASWMGHGIQVSAQHYLQVPAEVFELVTAPAGSAANTSKRSPRRPAAGRSALQNALQHGAAPGRIPLQTAPPLKIADSNNAA